MKSNHSREITPVYSTPIAILVQEKTTCQSQRILLTGLLIRPPRARLGELCAAAVPKQSYSAHNTTKDGFREQWVLFAAPEGKET